MSSTVEKIIGATTLSELLGEINEFCRDSYMRDDDTEFMALKEQVELKEDSDIHMILAAYLSACDNGDEIIESLYEFVSNCQGFAEAEEDTTQQVTKEEFETILDECDKKCGIGKCISQGRMLITAEVHMLSSLPEFGTKIKGKNTIIYLPRIEIYEDKTTYISDTLAGTLYDVLRTKFSEDEIKKCMNKYIPETRKAKESVKTLFKKYFYSVIEYEERKPDVYTDYDDHMKRVIKVEFYRQIIVRYFRE